MRGTLRVSRLRSAMTMLCIAIFLFSYVNATMFWHGHCVQGRWFYHSHICGAEHRSAQSDGGHTYGQFLQLAEASLLSFTDAAVPTLETTILRPVIVLLQAPPSQERPDPGIPVTALRGPPALV